MAFSKIVFTIFLFFISSFSFAGTNLYTDSYGNTTGTIDGQSVNLYRDAYGNTSGSVGGKSINTYTDAYGNTSGN